MTLTTPNILASYLYLMQSESMPIEHPDPQKDDQILEEWSKGSDVTSYDLNRLRRFINRTETLLLQIEEYVPISDESISQQYMSLFYEAAKDVFD